ncbi:MAG: ABC transporter ATP-binding protein, partial [Alphaproteobacteria bacterium]
LRERMRDELRALQRRLGITSLYVTHDQAEAMAISDRVVLMRAGAIEQDGPPAEVYARPRTAFAAEFMGSANILPARVVAADDGGIRVDIDGIAARLAPSGLALAPGDVVDCVVRPAHFRVGGAGGREAEVRRTVFQGGHAAYAVELAGRTCMVVDAGIHLRGIAEPGARIALSLDDAPVWPLAATQAGKDQR